MTATRRTGPRLIVAALVALGLGSGMVVALWLWTQHDGIEAVELTLTRAAPWLLLWRLGLFTVLILYWHEFVDRLAKSAMLALATTTALRRWRVRAGAGLIVMDLVLVEDALGLLRRAVL